MTPRPRAGYSTTLKAKTRLKRWLRRKRKNLWRKAKMRIRRSWKQHQRNRQRAARNQPIARTARQFQQHHANIHTQVMQQEHEPPPDGATSNCRRCSNGIRYNGGRQRWEHPGRGNWECFQPGGHT